MSFVRFCGALKRMFDTETTRRPGGAAPSACGLGPRERARRAGTRRHDQAIALIGSIVASSRVIASLLKPMR
ncbi:hypothetical protein GCM10022230_13090 [Pseudoclavibacter caeni]